MTTGVITLWHKRVTPLTSSVSTVHFLIEIMLILKDIKSHFKGHMTLVVCSFEIYETRRRLVHKFHMK